MTTQTITLTDFLLARITEDEEVAFRASSGPWVGAFKQVTSEPAAGEVDPVASTERSQDSHHIERWDPERVLAECDAKRQIASSAIPSGWTDEGEPLGGGYVEMWWDAIRILALPYADHPEYRDEWAIG